MKNFLKMLKDESGASAAEYALLLAIVGVGIVVAVTALGTSISGAMTRASTAIDGTATEEPADPDPSGG